MIRHLKSFLHWNFKNLYYIIIISVIGAFIAILYNYLDDRNIDDYNYTICTMKNNNEKTFAKVTTNKKNLGLLLDIYNENNLLYHRSIHSVPLCNKVKIIDTLNYDFYKVKIYVYNKSNRQRGYYNAYVYKKNIFPLSHINP